MPIIELFSKRQKKLRGEVSDIFIYDQIPQPLRVQIITIIKDAFGIYKGYGTDPIEITYKALHDGISREYGVFNLDEYAKSYEEAVFNYLLNTKSYEHVLDIVELSFRLIKNYVSKYKKNNDVVIRLEAESAIEELNTRFLEHGVGYRFEEDELLRIDSTFIHAEITKPVLNLLNSKLYSGANEEFLKAHEHYRHGRNQECLNECLKALESTLKIICENNNWKYGERDTASKLIDTCFTNNLIPSFMQTQFTSMRSLIESGVPTIRNRLGGHGQGNKIKTVDDDITCYALNLTASNIYYLIKLNEK